VFNTRPKSVTLIGKGSSELDYRLMTDKPVTDEVWGVNDIGMVYQLDRLWVMDDLKKSPMKCPYFDEYLRQCNVPIITSRAYPEYPTSVAFPLKSALEHVGEGMTARLFGNTISYACIYAEMIGVTDLYVWGVDFTDISDLEPYNEGYIPLATAFMFGRLTANGMNIHLSEKSRLLHLTDHIKSPFYGYYE